jgi:hypothetical protein
LVAVGEDIASIAAGSLLWRIYFRGGSHPTRWDELRHFGPTDARFDHHERPARVQSRGILYSANEGPTCIAEVFQATRVIDRRDRDPWLVGFRITRALRLLDMTGAWVTRAGASMAIHSGPRARARRWSAAIYAAFPLIDGIAYCSSMDGNRIAIALYERAADVLPATPAVHRALLDPVLAPFIAKAASRFGYLAI